MSRADFLTVAQKTEGYSNADLKALIKDVAMQPLRDVTPDNLVSMDVANLRPVTRRDFEASMRSVVPSVSRATI